MSKISLSPNASGTGTFTIQSPAGDTNRTFTLPDKDGEVFVGDIPASGSHNFVASGAISTGQVVALKEDGTIALTEVESTGDPVDFASSEITQVAGTYDSINNKVIVVTHQPSPYKGEAVIGTVSGNTITFGTPVTFRTTNVTEISVDYSPDHECIVIAYRVIGANYGTAIVGDVSSGTTISFGSEVTFYTGVSSRFSVVYHHAEQKFVILYKGASDGNYSVGTVSGTSITFGSVGTFHSGTVYNVKAIYDPDRQRIAILFTDSSAYAGMKTASLSGNTLTFATGASVYLANCPSIDLVYMTHDAILFATVVTSNSLRGMPFRSNSLGELTLVSSSNFIQTASATLGHMSSAYDKVAKKVLLSFDYSTNNFRYLYASWNGSDMFYEDLQYYTADTDIDNRELVFDDSSGKVAAFYRNQSDVKGTSVVFSGGNAANFIGVAGEDIADADSGNVTLLGSVNDQQAGLSVGSNYYVSPSISGGLTTDSSTGVTVGYAISSTELLLKGL